MYQGPLELRVRHFIQKHRLISGQHNLLVAVSGGADSICLLLVLLELREELGIGLHVAHLDHQLRGRESEADAQYVSDLARRLGIPATIEQSDVRAYQAREHLTLEEAAREVRYTFFTRVARSAGTDRVAVGHTTNDHIETILMHLIRGTGTRGLRGLQPLTSWRLADNNITVVRPLLPVSRRETAEYCRQHNLEPRIDASNLSLSSLRNRIRHELLPLLESYNPGIAGSLVRTARIAGDDLAFIDQESAKLWSEVIEKQGDTIILYKKKFLNLPSALKRHLLRDAIEKLSGSLKDIETRHIEEILEALARPAGKMICLPEGLVFSIEYDRYLLGPDIASLSPFPILDREYPLTVPGETPIPGWWVKATIVDHSAVKGKGKKGMGLIDGHFSACFDLDKAGDKLTVRPRQPGDRFQPLGMYRTKKLGEFMIDARIPHAWRDRIPIVCSNRHILWIVGWHIDDRVKVTENTKQVLYLKFERH